MSASADLQRIIAAHLSEVLPVRVPVVVDRPKDLAGKIDVAAAIKGGLCVIVKAALPQRTERSGSVLFIRSANVQLQIVEQPAVNPFAPFNAYDLAEEIMLALHWEPNATIEPKIRERIQSEGETHAEAEAAIRATGQHQTLFQLADIIEHPLQVAETATSLWEGSLEASGAAGSFRILSVNIEAAYGLRRAET